MIDVPQREQPLSILLSIHHPLQRDSGAPGVTMRLAEALRRRGHCTDILSFDSLGGLGSTQRYRFPWHVAGHVLRNRRYDVLDLSSGDGWMIGLLAPFLGPGRPVVLSRSHGLEHSFHDILLQESRRTGRKLSWKYPIYSGGFRLWECRTAFAAADAALLLNPAEAQYATARLGVAARRAVQIRNGLAQVFVETARPRLAEAPPAGRPTGIAFVGSHLARKGVMVLRDAMCQVLQREPEARLGYFGVLTDPTEVLALYPPGLRRRIAVVPRYDNADLPKLLARYHILAFPSLFEGFPGTPLEAMACGLVPIVADAAGCMVYVGHDRNGLVVPAGDASALRDAIGGLLSDPGRWAELRRAALTTSLDFSWDNVAAEMELIYRNCLAQRRLQTGRSIGQGAAPADLWRRQVGRDAAPPADGTL